MINISHLYKSLLSKDIENNINAKIENIKFTNNWSDLNVKSAYEKIDFTTLGIEDVKYHAAILENISKLSVDLILDYDYYKHFIFKGHFRSVDYYDKLKKLGYEIRDDYWQNVTKPSRDTVIMNVFLSCLYNSLVEIMDDRFKNKEFNDTLGNMLVEDLDFKAENKLIIKTCDTDLNYDEEQTDLRNPEITLDIRNNTLNETDEKIETTRGNHSNIDLNFWICETCTLRNGNESNWCSYCGSFNVVETEWKCLNKNFERTNDDIKITKFDSEHLLNEINIGGEIEKLNTIDSSKLKSLETQSGKDKIANKNMEIFHDILKKNQNRWICNSCECLNQFNLVNCQACTAPCKVNGYWMCCHCNFVSTMHTDICDVCGAKNELIVPANKWKCWKPHCDAFNDDKFIFCNKCGLQRIPPVLFSDLVERKVQGKIIRLWICEKCWQYNFDNSKICDKKCCGEPRFKQTSKTTDKTNIKTCDNYMNLDEEQTDLRNPETTFDITNNTLNEKDERKIENHSNIDRSSWICEKCTFQNVNESDNCYLCESVNVVETEWKCWNKKCEKMNKIGHHFCQTCKLDKTPPDPDTNLVKIYARNEMREIWICGRCEKHNAKDKFKCEGKSCGSFRFHISNDYKDGKSKAEIPANQNKIKTNSCQWECHKCTFINNGNGKRCTVCNSKRNDNSNSSSWKCWFVNCKQINDNQYKFCQHCKLDRFGNSDGGAVVQYQDKNGPKDIWICQECFNYNSLFNEVCRGNSCKNQRFQN